MALFGSFWTSDRDFSQRYRWRVIHLDGPITKQIGLDAEFGVVISSDVMLEKTQTLLFCPLINGMDEKGRSLAKLPWHVDVSISQTPNQVSVPYSRKLLSTKIVLPISLNEVDRDGLQRGRLSPDSRVEVARMLKRWLPVA